MVHAAFLPLESHARPAHVTINLALLPHGIRPSSDSLTDAATTAMMLAALAMHFPGKRTAAASQEQRIMRWMDAQEDVQELSAA